MKSEETWSERNLNHIVLSDKTANQYDSSYAENNYQTRQYMKYEEEFLEESIKSVENTELAIELGCGTGRDLFKYARKFDQAIGWDFSPKMVEVTREKARNMGFTNVTTEIRDVEKNGYDGIAEESVDFINAGFGMGSFIENFPEFLNKTYKVLKKDGIFMATFYNKQSIAKYVVPPCFAAMPNIEEKKLTVTSDGIEYEIPCITYSVDELKKIYDLAHFQIIKAYTYPTVSTLLSKECVKVPEIISIVNQLEESIKECLWGHYIIILCKK